MELKIVDGLVIPKGHVLVVVMPFVPSEESRQLWKYAKSLEIEMLLLPPGSQVYSVAKEVESVNHAGCQLGMLCTCGTNHTDCPNWKS